MATHAKTPQQESTTPAKLSKPVARFEDADYRALVANSPMPIAVHIKGVVVYANKATLKLMGAKSDKELLGRNVLDFVHPDSKPIVIERIGLLYEKGKRHTDTVEEKLIRSDGSVIQVEITSLLFELDGELAVQIMLRDVTEHYKAQAELLRAKRETDKHRHRLEDLFMNAPASIAILRGPDHVIELANPLFMELTGREQNIIGLPIRDSFPEIAEQGFFAMLDTVYNTGRAFVGNEVFVRFIMPGKALEKGYYFNFVNLPSRSADGKVDGILLHGVDVTDQVHARQEIEYSNSLLTTITDNTSMGLLMMDEHHHCTFINQTATAITGFTLEEMKGAPLHSFIHRMKADGEAYPLKDCPIAKAMPEFKRQHGEDTFVRKDGTYYPVRYTASPIVRGKKPIGTLLEIQDITEERLAQAALRDSEESFRQLADSMPQMVWTADAAGNFTYRNRLWYEYLGKDDEPVDSPLWGALVHPDDQQPAIAKYWEATQAGEPYEAEIRMRKSLKAENYGWFLARAVPVKDKSGKITKWFGTATDITDIRRTTKRSKELETIAEALREQRTQLVALNKAKDEFISLASHQLRTPATGVKQYIGMALEGYAGDLTPDMRLFLERAYESNERQINVINDLLQVAQVDAGKVVLDREPTDLVELIRSVILEQSSRFMVRDQIVTFKPKMKELVVSADEARLRMVLDNLIDNASKYTPHNKSIEIKLTKRKDMVCIAIADEGVGIPEADVAKIFRKFSRLDNPLSAHVGGSGLGLYWAQKIVNLHEGSIKVESVVNKGSTFTICLPAK
jgi:PAS domain S-box-containing protein